MTRHMRLTARSLSVLRHFTGLLVVFVLINATDAVKHFPCKLETEDRIFFPDQLEYLRVWLSRCACEQLVYWPPNDQCYDERTQGPCSVGRVLVFDRKKIEPRCERAS